MAKIAIFAIFTPLGAPWGTLKWPCLRPPFGGPWPDPRSPRGVLAKKAVYLGLLL